MSSSKKDETDEVIGARLSVDSAQRVTRWSTALEALSGRASGDVVGARLAEVLVALDLETFPILSPGETWSGAVALKPAGQGVPILARALVSADMHGETLIGLVPTTKASAGGSVPSEQQHLRHLLRHLRGFSHAVDAQLNFTFSAGAGLGALNLEDGQVVGMNLTELWGTNDPHYEPLRCHLRALNGTPQSYQDVCLGRSLSYQLEPLRNEHGEVVGVVGLALDVTEQTQAQEAQARLAAQLRQAQKMEAIGRLAGGIAHDFNNLLTCIIGNLTLAEHWASGDPTVAYHLAEASAAADSAAALTRQLLTYSRKQVVVPQEVNVTELVSRLQGMLQRMIGEGVRLSAECAEDLWSVRADAGQLEQMLVNLIVNARDAIDGYGEVAIRTRNMELPQTGAPAPESLSPGQYVVISVQDDGCGMAASVKEKLFEPFFTTKESGEGTGLGLATVHGAVQQAGGAITVDSELGKGSTFTVYLPAEETEARHKDSAISEPPVSMPRGAETILLVEDEPLLLNLAQCTLEQLGYRVLPCASSDEALRRLEKRGTAVDLLFTDVVMPRMSGHELAARVRALYPGVSVLYCSGYGEDIVRQRGTETEEFIPKPYRPNQLAMKVRAVLDSRNKQRSGERATPRLGLGEDRSREAN